MVCSIILFYNKYFYKDICGINKYFLCRANGESSSSKNQHLGDSNAHGLRPDFRLICKDTDEFEILFGEIKPPKVENHKSIVNQALSKLAILMKDALDIGIYDETYGILINGK